MDLVKRKVFFNHLYKHFNLLLLLCIGYTVILIGAMIIDVPQLYQNANRGIEILEKEGE